MLSGVDGWAQVISQDLQGSGMKNKKHWNSFATVYFRDASNVMKQLRELGHACVDEDTAAHLLKCPLECHRCHERLANFPALKAHFGSCRGPYPEAENYPNELTHLLR